jgi:hypothetical protein
MRRTWEGLLVVLALALLPTGGAAAKDAAAPEPPRPDAAGGSLDLSIRARALGLTGDVMPLVPPSLEFEAERAPTGAGTSRWPSSRTELGKGVYIDVSPVCIPGVDEPAFPPLLRRSPRR